MEKIKVWALIARIFVRSVFNRNIDQLVSKEVPKLEEKDLVTTLLYLLEIKGEIK